MNNEQLFVNEKNREVKERGGWVGIIFIFLSISLFRDLRREDLFKKVFDYFDFGLKILGVIGIIAIFYYLFFMRKSNRKLIINEIENIEIEKGELETELSLIFSNKRQKDLEFRTHEYQIKPFLEALKKRNSKVIIKEI